MDVDLEVIAVNINDDVLSAHVGHNAAISKGLG
jgi:hypothetical protein